MAKDQLMDLEKALELFEPVLGFEVHVELSTDTKMFSAAPNPAAMDEATVDPNTCITPLCLGLPGSLPVVNEKAVEYSISLGLALGCDIAPVSRFARKNYFYPDLAKNYQISQYDEPIAFEGSVSVEMDDGTLVEVPIERAHMEEDAGKLTHVGGATGRIQGQSIPSSITTAPVFPWSRSSPSPSRAWSTGRESWVARTCRPFATSCETSVFRMRGWSAETCAVTRTCPFAPAARRPMAPGLKPRTSTRLGPSSAR